LSIWSGSCFIQLQMPRRLIAFTALRVRADRARLASAIAPQHDTTSDRGLDVATTAGSHRLREWLSIPSPRSRQHLRPAPHESISRLGLMVLKSPPHSPKANTICERVIGTIRRECLDWLIPVSESHLRSMLKEWVTHYNAARPHMALGPGVPDPPPATVRQSTQRSRHLIDGRLALRVKSILGGLHHEYSLAPALG